MAKKDKVFDPKKNYKWEPTDTIELTGQQFASLYHLLNKEMNDAGGAPLLLKAEAHGVVMEIFRKNVALGVISEVNLEDDLQVAGDNVKQLFKK